MENWPALTGVAALAFLCDRVLAWMGERGWIYWRERVPSFAEARRPRLRDPERAIRPPRRPRRRLGGRSRPRA